MEYSLNLIYIPMIFIGALIVAIRYFKLKKYLSVKGSTFREHFSNSNHKRSLISTIIVSIGMYGYFFTIIPSMNDGQLDWLAPFSIPFILITVLGILFQVYNYYESKQNPSIDMDAITEEKLRGQLKGSKFMMMYFVSLPFWLAVMELSGIYYGLNKNKLLGYDISDISSTNLMIIAGAWTLIYGLSCISLFHFYRCSQEMIAGNFYSSKAIYQLSQAGKLLAVTGFIMLMYSFFESILTGSNHQTFSGYLIWISYYIIILSVFIQYLSRVIKRAAILKEENDLTI